MLVSEKNSIGSKLHDRISTILSIDLVSPSSIGESTVDLPAAAPPIIFINQLDVGMNERDLFTTLRQKYPATKIIALNTHMVQSLKDRTLESGYDGYLSLFELGQELSNLLFSLDIETIK